MSTIPTADDPTPDRWSLTGVRHTTPSGVIDDVTVVVEDGIIADITSGPGGGTSIDGRGLLALPGLVCSHSDGLEKERAPRRTAIFPLDFALLTFENRLLGAGVTTVFHGIGFEEQERNGRSVALAEASCQAIAERRPDAPVDHRLLVRTEARSDGGVTEALPWIERFTEMVDGQLVTPLVSFEDHSPGQGQYRDVDSFRAAVDPSGLEPGQSVDAYVADRIAEADRARHRREDQRRQLADLAAAGTIRLLAHDCEGPDEVEEAHAGGAAIAEFPLTLEAARRAKELDMFVVMGAPNALRGRSHSGNAAAAELVAAGVCDVLASDYQPATLLAAAFTLARTGVCELHDAIALITSGPATATGLTDRGRLAVGQRADIILVDDRGRWPQVRNLWHTPSSLHDQVTT